VFVEVMDFWQIFDSVGVGDGFLVDFLQSWGVSLISGRFAVVFGWVKDFW